MHRYISWFAAFALGVMLAGWLLVAWPAPALADGGAPNLAYIAGTGAKGDEVAILDIAKHQVTGHVVVGGEPRALALSFDARTLYVAQAGKNTVAAIDTHAQQIAATIAVGKAPAALAINSMLSPALFVANSGDGTVTLIDPNANTIQATIPVGHDPEGIAVAGPGTGIASSNDLEVYVANRGDNSVSILSYRQRKAIATVAVPGGPEGVVVPPSSGVAYVSTHAGTIAVIGLATHQFLGTLLTVAGATFGRMDYNAITNQVYVPDMAHNTVVILAPATAGANGQSHLPPEPARALPMSGGPAAVAITFDGAFAFIAQQGSGQVTELDAATRQTLAQVAVGGAPGAIITGSYPPILNRQTASVVGIIVSVVLLAGIGGVGLLLVVRKRK